MAARIWHTAVRMVWSLGHRPFGLEDGAQQIYED